MGIGGVHYRDLRDEDVEWVLGAMVASMRATMTPEASAAKSDLVMLAEARADLDRYHYRAKGADKFIIAVRGSERMGLSWVTMEKLHQDPGAAWLLEVFVEPLYRRQGLARELMDRAEQWAREQGADAIWLNVGGENRSALGLYRTQGYIAETMHLSKRL